MQVPELLKDIPVSHLAPVRKDAVAQQEEAQGILEQIDLMVMERQEDFDFAGSILTEVKGKKKALEDERGKATRGILDSLNVIRGWFKPPIQYYDRCEKALKDKMSAYTRAKREEQAAALKAAGEASMQGNAQVAQQALQVASAAQVHKTAGVSVIEVVKYEVQNFQEVPRQFLCINDAAIRQYIQANGAEVKIPGVRIFRDTQIRVRAK